MHAWSNYNNLTSNEGRITESEMQSIIGKKHEEDYTQTEALNTPWARDILSQFKYNGSPIQQLNALVWGHEITPHEAGFIESEVSRRKEIGTCTKEWFKELVSLDRKIQRLVDDEANAECRRLGLADKSLLTFVLRALPLSESKNLLRTSDNGFRLLVELPSRKISCSVHPNTLEEPNSRKERKELGDYTRATLSITTIDTDYIVLENSFFARKVYNEFAAQYVKLYFE